MKGDFSRLPRVLLHFVEAANIRADASRCHQPGGGPGVLLGGIDVLAGFAEVGWILGFSRPRRRVGNICLAHHVDDRAVG